MIRIILITIAYIGISARRILTDTAWRNSRGKKRPRPSNTPTAPLRPPPYPYPTPTLPLPLAYPHSTPLRCTYQCRVTTHAASESAQLTLVLAHTCACALSALFTCGARRERCRALLQLQVVPSLKKRSTPSSCRSPRRLLGASRPLAYPNCDAACSCRIGETSWREE